MIFLKKNIKLIFYLLVFVAGLILIYQSIEYGLMSANKFFNMPKHAQIIDGDTSLIPVFLSKFIDVYLVIGIIISLLGGIGFLIASYRTNKNNNSSK